MNEDSVNSYSSSLIDKCTANSQKDASVKVYFIGIFWEKLFLKLETGVLNEQNAQLDIKVHSGGMMMLKIC